MSTETTLRKFTCSASESKGGFMMISKSKNYYTRTFREHSAIVEAEDEKGASQAFHALTGHHPDVINLRVVLGFCEACSVPIFDGDDCSTDEEGVSVCEACLPANHLGLDATLATTTSNTEV